MTAVGLVLALGLAACGTGDHDQARRSPGSAPTSTATTPATAPQTTTAADPTKAVLAVYKRDWQLWLEDNNPPNPDDPRLAEVEIDPQLSATREGIRKHQAEGVVLTLPAHSHYHHNPRAFLPNPDHAAIVDCAIDDGVQRVASTGKVVNDKVETQLIQTAMVLVDGSWKVSWSSIQRTWPGEATCTDV